MKINLKLIQIFVRFISSEMAAPNLFQNIDNKPQIDSVQNHCQNLFYAAPQNI